MNIIEAQNKLYGELKQSDGIIGAGNDGKLITILVLDEESESLVPTKYEGYDVVSEVTGHIYLQKD